MAENLQPILDDDTANYYLDQTTPSAPHHQLCQPNETGSMEQFYETVTNASSFQPAPIATWDASINHGETAPEPHHQRVGLEPAAWPTVDHYLSSFDKAQYDQARFDRKPSLSEPPSQSHLPPQSLNYPNYTPYDPALSYDQSTPSLLQRSSQASSAQTSRQPAFPPLGLTSSGSCSPAGNHIPETEIRAQVLKQVATTAYEAFVKATPQIIDEALKNIPATLLASAVASDQPPQTTSNYSTPVPIHSTTSSTTSGKKRSNAFRYNLESPSSRKRLRLDSIDYENIKGLRGTSGDEASDGKPTPKRGRGRPRKA